DSAPRPGRPSAAGGRGPRRGERGPVRVRAEPDDQVAVLGRPVVVVAGDSAGGAVRDPFRLVAEGVPDALPPAAGPGCALDLVRGCRDAPEKPGHAACSCASVGSTLFSGPVTGQYWTGVQVDATSRRGASGPAATLVAATLVAFFLQAARFTGDPGGLARDRAGAQRPRRCS